MISRAAHSLLGMMLSLLGLLGLEGCSPTANEEPALDIAGAEARLRGSEPDRERQYDVMARVLQLDPASAQALERAFTTRDESIDAWLSTDKGQRLTELEARLFGAVEKRNLSEVRAITGEAAPLRDELRQLMRDQDRAIMETLRPDQQLAWQGYEVAAKMLELMKPLDLAFEQAQAIESAGPSAVDQAIRAGEPTPQAAAFLALEEWVENQVLSEPQRTEYQAIKAENKLRSLSI